MLLHQELYLRSLGRLAVSAFYSVSLQQKNIFTGAAVFSLAHLVEVEWVDLVRRVDIEWSDVEEFRQVPRTIPLNQSVYLERFITIGPFCRFFLGHVVRERFAIVLFLFTAILFAIQVFTRWNRNEKFMASSRSLAKRPMTSSRCLSAVARPISLFRLRPNDFYLVHWIFNYDATWFSHILLDTVACWI